jgi:hypothetical protein
MQMRDERRGRKFGSKRAVRRQSHAIGLAATGQWLTLFICYQLPPILPSAPVFLAQARSASLSNSRARPRLTLEKYL